MMKIYGNVYSRAGIVMCALETLGLEYEYIPYLPKGPEIKTAEYLALNPAGKVPTLVDGDLVLWETQAILFYIAEQYGQGQLWADTAKERADIYRWAFFISNHLEGFALDIFTQHRFVAEADRDAAVIARANRELDLYIPLLEKPLENHEYILGDKPTVVDIHGASILSWAKLVGYDTKRFPSVDAWIKKQIKSEAQQKVNAKA